ncbi:DUF4145 domain-containing protein [Rhodobacter sp. Har01]|uniref:DUF4145 domain-containing protein n=1 Tax=Rhodobacter sp. Har01 TaxID=2883999 RepID=UPI001D085972|nr:DUF4145 domain-containing protein [Rhodobacter sp. Har01]MCB6179031.1 DUF4145 domain-containing protein [Rhodobacter sp. Har01]
MRRFGKDSSEVVEFMAFFARLKLYSDDAPEDLAEMAARDSSVMSICAQLFLSADYLRMNERRSRVLFAAPVDPAFLAAWRDYEERYETIVSSIWLSELLPELASTEPSRAPKADLRWMNADDEAGDQAGVIEEAIEFAQFNADQEDRWIDQPDFMERVQDGIAAWERLSQDTGFDLQGVFRRRALIPFVLVPRHIAAKHGSAETLSMLKNLQQAHDAFIFGATFAAVALMRSIMEAVLRDHYRAEGKDLSERIRNARGRLPPGASEGALHRLRKLANAILHLDHEKDEGLLKMDQAPQEKEIVSLLFALRALIERAE